MEWGGGVSEPHFSLLGPSCCQDSVFLPWEIHKLWEDFRFGDFSNEKRDVNVKGKEEEEDEEEVKKKFPSNQTGSSGSLHGDHHRYWHPGLRPQLSGGGGRSWSAILHGGDSDQMGPCAPLGAPGSAPSPHLHCQCLQALRWLITTGWSTRGERGELSNPHGILGWLAALAWAPAWLPGSPLITQSLLMGMGRLRVPCRLVPAPSAAAAAHQQGSGQLPVLCQPAVPCQPRGPWWVDPHQHRPCYGAEASSWHHGSAATAVRARVKARGRTAAQQFKASSPQMCTEDWGAGPQPVSAGHDQPGHFKAVAWLELAVCGWWSILWSNLREVAFLTYSFPCRRGVLSQSTNRKNSLLKRRWLILGREIFLELSKIRTVIISQRQQSIMENTTSSGECSATLQYNKARFKNRKSQAIL